MAIVPQGKRPRSSDRAGKSNARERASNDRMAAALVGHIASALVTVKRESRDRYHERATTKDARRIRRSHAGYRSRNRMRK